MKDMGHHGVGDTDIEYRIIEVEVSLGSLIYVLSAIPKFVKMTKYADFITFCF